MLNPVLFYEYTLFLYFSRLIFGDNFFLFVIRKNMSIDKGVQEDLHKLLQTIPASCHLCIFLQLDGNFSGVFFVFFFFFFFWFRLKILS